jgi:hypothetical protein
MNLESIVCPNWLPGTNEILPDGVLLSPELKLKNKLRCYCEVVKPAERLCIEMHSATVCKERTDRWVEQNLSLQRNILPAIPRRGRLINLEP